MDLILLVISTINPKPFFFLQAKEKVLAPKRKSGIMERKSFIFRKKKCYF